MNPKIVQDGRRGEQGQLVHIGSTLQLRIGPGNALARSIQHRRRIEARDMHTDDTRPWAVLVSPELRLPPTPLRIHGVHVN